MAQWMEPTRGTRTKVSRTILHLRWAPLIHPARWRGHLVGSLKVELNARFCLEDTAQVSSQE